MTSRAIRIRRAVVDRLTGYAAIMYPKDLCVLNTVAIQVILVTQIPRTVRRDGTSDIPKPLKYPDMTS